MNISFKASDDSHWRLRAGVVVVVCAVALASPAAQALPASLVAAMVGRVLAYDRRLAERADGQVDVLVVGHAGSETDESAALAALAGGHIKDLPVAVTLATPAPSELRALIASHKPDAVFVDGRADLMPELVALARANGFLIVVTDRKLLDVGAHLAIIEVGGKPRVMVSLAATRAAGIQLSADLLSIAIVGR